MGRGSCQGHAWQEECQGQFRVQNPEGHAQELYSDGNVPDVLLTGLAKAMAVWRDAAIVSDPNPISLSRGLCLASDTLRTILATKNKDPVTSKSARDRKGNPDLV